MSRLDRECGMEISGRTNIKETASTVKTHEKNEHGQSTYHKTKTGNEILDIQKEEMKRMKKKLDTQNNPKERFRTDRKRGRLGFGR